MHRIQIHRELEITNGKENKLSCANRTTHTGE